MGSPSDVEVIDPSHVELIKSQPVWTIYFSVWNMDHVLSSVCLKFTRSVSTGTLASITGRFSLPLAWTKYVINVFLCTYRCVFHINQFFLCSCWTLENSTFYFINIYGALDKKGSVSHYPEQQGILSNLLIHEAGTCGHDWFSCEQDLACRWEPGCCWPGPTHAGWRWLVASTYLA